MNRWYRPAVQVLTFGTHPCPTPWIDGAAALPLPPMHGSILLEIHLAGAVSYVVDTVPTGRTGPHAA